MANIKYTSEWSKDFGKAPSRPVAKPTISELVADAKEAGIRLPKSLIEDNQPKKDGLKAVVVKELQKKSTPPQPKTKE